MKCPWKEWAQNGRLTVVDDVEINPHYITDWLKDAKKNYNIRALAIDDFRFALLAGALEDIGFDCKARKNLKMVRPSDIMRVAPVIDSLFANHNLVWGDAPEMRWATNNAKLIRYGRNLGQSDDADLGNFVYGKIEGRSRKTDPFMAFVAAMAIEDRIIERKSTPQVDVVMY